MASKVLIMIFAVAMATALVTAEAFDDLTGADLDEILGLISKRGDSNDAGMVFDEAFDEMDKRGRGGRMFFRCTHPLNGFNCICDKRFRETSPKYFRVCGYGGGQ
nr:uncharacterized protein LOC129266673 [Lytechinus pictus]